VVLSVLVYFLLASGDLYRRKLVKIAGPSLATRKSRSTSSRESIADREILLVQMFTSIVVAVVTGWPCAARFTAAASWACSPASSNSHSVSRRGRLTPDRYRRVPPVRHDPDGGALGVSRS